MPAGEQIEVRADVAAVHIERLLVEAQRRGRIGEGRHGVEVGDVAVIDVEIVELALVRVHVGGGVGIAAPAVAARVDAVEEPLLGVLDGEVEAEKLGAFAQVDDAAVLLEIAADVGQPAVAEIDAAGEPVLGGGRRRLRRGWRPVRRPVVWRPSWRGAAAACSSGLACGAAGPRRLLRERRRHQDKGQ